MKAKPKKLLLSLLSWILTLVVALAAGLFLRDYMAGCSHRNLLNAELSFRIEDKNGKQVTLSDFPQKPVVINFWAIWCGPCKTELPAFQSAYDKYKDEVTFLFINTRHWQNNSVEQIENFLQENGYTFPTYYDEYREAEKECNVTSIPLTLFIGKDGKVKDTHSGTISKNKLENSIQHLLSQVNTIRTALTAGYPRS